MFPRLLLLAALAATALVLQIGSAGAAAARTCSPGFVHASLSWGEKCLQAGEFCKVGGDAEYHRYRFHCHAGGRLSRSAAAAATSGGGCEPGYDPCLPRVADLNCADIPPSKRPVRVSGSDRYRLDGDGDGRACE